jgi:hypothetical protein
MNYDTLTRALFTEFGMHFRMYDTSGNNWCLRAVTETGHWLHITDAYDSLTYDRTERAEEGYGVTVFTADDQEGGSVYANCDPDALTNADVIALVRDAIANMR